MPERGPERRAGRPRPPRRLGQPHRRGVAAVKRVVVLGLADPSGPPAATTCRGLGGQVPPLATFQVEATGDLGPLRRRRHLRRLAAGRAGLGRAVAAPSRSASFRRTRPAPAGSRPVIAAGCRDPFGFVPTLVAASVPVTIGTPTTLPLFDPPPTDVLVGDVTSRVAYASLVFYDDRDGDRHARSVGVAPDPFGGDDGPDQQDMADSSDVVYGASFLTMTAPDQRVSFLEGAFNPMAAFYPRSGCARSARRGFRVLGAGGFSADAAFSPRPPRAPCRPRTILPNAPTDRPRRHAGDRSRRRRRRTSRRSPAQSGRSTDRSRYRQPPTDAPDFTATATSTLAPSFRRSTPAIRSNLIQLVVSGLPTDHCKGLTHYTLRGCREDVSCAVPDWDFTANPPAWWPC